MHFPSHLRQSTCRVAVFAQTYLRHDPNIVSLLKTLLYNVARSGRSMTFSFPHHSDFPSLPESERHPQSEEEKFPNISSGRNPAEQLKHLQDKQAKKWRVGNEDIVPDR